MANHQRNFPQHNRRHLRTRKTNSRCLELVVEPLETRQMLAGTVTVSVVNDTLSIFGDDFSNGIKIDPFQSVPANRVVGLNGTTVVFANDIDAPYQNVEIETGEGDDVVEIENMFRNGKLTFFNIDGSDSLMVDNSGFDGFVDIQNGEGNQTTMFDGVFIGGNTTINNAGDGSNLISMSDGGTRQLHVTAKNGFDEIFVTRTQIGENGPNNTGTIDIDTGAGGAKVEIVSSGTFGRSIHGGVSVKFGVVDTSSVLALNRLLVKDVRVRRGVIDVQAKNGVTSIEVDGADRISQIKVKSGDSTTPNSLDVTRLDVKNTQIETGGIQVTTDEQAVSVDLVNSTVAKKVVVKAKGTHGINGFNFANSTIGKRADFLVTTRGAIPSGALQHEYVYKFTNNTVIEGPLRLKSDGRAEISEVEMINSAVTGLLSHSGIDDGINSVFLNNSQIQKNVQATHFSGSSVVEISNNARIGGNLIIKKNKGDTSADTLMITGDSQVSRNVMAANSSGSSDTQFFDAIIGGNTTISNGSGSDALAIDNSEFRGNVFVKNFTGESVTAIADSSFLKKLALDNGGKLKGDSETSFDQLIVGGLDVHGTFVINHGAGGSHTEIVDLVQSSAFSFNATHGADLLKINDVQMQNRTTINTGTKSAAEAAEVGGNDNDQIFLDRDGSPGVSVYAGTLKITTTEGDDQIRLAGNLSFVNTATFESQVTVDGGNGNDEFVEGIFSLFNERPKLISIETVID